MDVIIKISQFLLGISILVLIHEAGHYLAARAFGIKVEKFYLFFDVGGFKLFKFRRGETEYGIGWLPLGGYVKIVGMIDESMDKDFVQSEPKPWEFRAKPAWQRLIVMLGGIIMNVILGVLIFTLHTAYYGETFIHPSEMNNGIEVLKLGKEAGFQTGDIITAINGKPLDPEGDRIGGSYLITEKNVTYDVLRQGQPVKISLDEKFASKYMDHQDSFIFLRQTFKVESVKKESFADKAGLKEGDSIVAINNSPIPFYHQLTESLKANKGKNITLTVKREKDKKWLTEELKAQVDTEGHLGFMPGWRDTTKTFSLGESFVHGSSKAWHAITDNVKALARIIGGDLPANKSVHGIIGIANAFAPVWNWHHFWNMTALLSMVLAFMNLLPIPALDGGHVIFLLVEMVRRKPLSYRFLEVAQMVGMIILFLLMGFALYNDVTQYWIK